jgi:PhoPQ-activated pathogenicity-related protein
MLSKTLFVALICSLLVLGGFAGSRRKTPLEKYVHADDDTFDWEQVSSISTTAYTAYVLNFTSQTWLTAAESSRPIWTHTLTVCVPNDVSHNVAFLYVNNGNIGDAIPTTVNNIIDYLCRVSHAVTVHLQQVPNQPFTFTDDPAQKLRTEDGIIAYTWKKFVNNTNTPAKWLLQFPQTKSAVRAMDAIQEFTDTLDIPRVKSFIVSGASKRGWTTWLAAGVDKRVEAFAPIVMPILNMQPNLNNMYRSLGGWTWAFRDYWYEDVMSHMNKPEFKTMIDLIDPIIFNNVYTSKPTYIITASQDEFFQPDSVNFFFQDLRGEKYLRVLPGAGHSFDLTYPLSDLLDSVNGFIQMVGSNLRGPRDLNWRVIKTTSRTQPASIIAVSGTRPKKVVMWSTNTISTTQRDFRLHRCLTATGAGCQQRLNWTSTDITAQYGSIYTASRTAPAQGWGLFYLEFHYDINERGRYGDKYDFTVTSEVNIVPDVLPFPSCETHCGAPQSHLANPE